MTYLAALNSASRNSWHRKCKIERCPLARCGIDSDLPAMIFHDSINNRQAQPRSFSDGLGGEKRLEDPVQVFLWNTGPVSETATSQTASPEFIFTDISPPGYMAWAALRMTLVNTC